VKKAIIAVVLTVSVTGAVGQCTGMKRYVDNSLGFELSYPASYRVTDLPCRFATGFALEGFQSLLYVSTGTGRNHGNILLILDRRHFSLATLQTVHAHTGWVKPDRIQIGKLTFYYYGVGGGGVAYPDDYFYDLGGAILEISFDGPYPTNSKTPSVATKQMERRVLESLRLFAAITPSGK
jgi:hypothetical protein